MRQRIFLRFREAKSPTRVAQSHCNIIGAHILLVLSELGAFRLSYVSRWVAQRFCGGSYSDLLIVDSAD